MPDQPRSLLRGRWCHGFRTNPPRPPSTLCYRKPTPTLGLERTTSAAWFPAPGFRPEEHWNTPKTGVWQLTGTEDSLTRASTVRVAPSLQPETGPSVWCDRRQCRLSLLQGGEHRGRRERNPVPSPDPNLV